MRVLVLHSGTEMYGSDQSLLENLKAFKAVRESHITAVLHKDGELRKGLQDVCDEIEIDNYGVLSRADVGKSFVRSLARVLVGSLKLLRRIRGVDMIYVNTLPVFSVYLVFPFLVSKKKLIFVREVPTGFQRVTFSFLLWMARANLIFNSDKAKSAFPEIVNRKSYVLQNCVDAALVDFESRVFKLSPQGFKVLQLGRVYPLKGQHLALEAVLKITRRDLPINLRIVGGISVGREQYADDLKEFVAQSDLSNYVEFWPFQNNVDELYRWADIVIVPSVLPESFGRTVIEGMAHGCIVIAANHGGPAELISDGENGFLFNPGSSDDLCRVITSIVSDPQKMEKISGKAKLYYLDNFSVDTYRQKFKEILEKLG